MNIVLVSKFSLDLEQYMLNLKCQFWYRPQRASLARIGSQIMCFPWKLQNISPFQCHHQLIHNVGFHEQEC